MKKFIWVIAGFLILAVAIIILIKNKKFDTFENKIKVSSVFENGQTIPSKYTCDGLDISPPLFLKDLPLETKSLVIIVEDIDAPQGIFTHWLAWNIEPTSNISEGYQPPNEGLNDFGKINYGGPCPPPGNKAHRYFFKVIALNSFLNFPNGSRKEDILPALKGKILAEGELMGVYQR